MTMTAANYEITNWVKAYTSEMLSYALSKTSHKETAEDIVHDTFLAALESYEKFKGGSNPKTWLFAILKNKIADYLRHKYKVSNNNEPVDPIAICFGKDKRWKKLHEPKNWNINEGELLDNVEFIAVFKTCFDELPDKWSTAMKLKYLYTTNSKDICGNLGITLSNFWQIIHRAKLQLRSCFEINWFDNKETRR